MGFPIVLSGDSAPNCHSSNPGFWTEDRRDVVCVFSDDTIDASMCKVAFSCAMVCNRYPCGASAGTSKGPT